MESSITRALDIARGLKVNPEDAVNHQTLLLLLTDLELTLPKPSVTLAQRLVIDEFKEMLIANYKQINWNCRNLSKTKTLLETAAAKLSAVGLVELSGFCRSLMVAGINSVQYALVWQWIRHTIEVRLGCGYMNVPDWDCRVGFDLNGRAE